MNESYVPCVEDVAWIFKMNVYERCTSNIKSDTHLFQLNGAIRFFVDSHIGARTQHFHPNTNENAKYQQQQNVNE